MAGRMPGYDKTFDMQPHAGEANFDDSKWQVIEPKGLGDRRGGGKSSFLWYRTTLTIPAKVGDPISVAPSNFIFFRDAKVEFYR